VYFCLSLSPLFEGNFLFFVRHLPCFAVDASEIDPVCDLFKLWSKDVLDSVRAIVASIYTLVKLFNGSINPYNGKPQVQCTGWCSVKFLGNVDLKMRPEV